MGAGTKRSAKEPVERKRAQHPLWKASVCAFGVTWLAALVRWWPLTQYAVWGSDQGEHGALLDNYIARGGQMPSTYLGWGGGYPDFPGMYAFASAFASISGVDPFTVLSVVVPAAASLTALLAFAMTLRLSGSLRASTLAGAIVATAMPEAFAGSHAMPGALGGMLAFAIVLALLVCARAPGGRGAIVVLAVAVVATHHLSAFLAAAALAGVAVCEARFAPADRARYRTVDGALLGASALLLLSAFDWAFLAPNFRAVVLDRTSPLIARLLPAVAVFAVLALVILVWFLETLPRSHRPFSRIMDEAKTFRRFGLAAVLALLALAIVSTVGVPGTSVVLSPLAAATYLPIAFMLAVAVGGLGRIAPVRGALVPFGAAAGILFSMFVGSALLPTVLLPYRHVQYLVDAAAPLSAVAISFAVRSFASEAIPSRTVFHRPVTALLLAGLIAASMATAYPTKEAFGGYQEGTTSSEIAAIVWLHWQVPQTLVATDHRLSSLAFGYANQQATWEASAPILTGDLTATKAALNSTASPSGRTGVTVVLLSRDVISGAALSQWEPARPISGPALAKFNGPPFVKVFDDGDAVAYWVAEPV